MTPYPDAGYKTCTYAPPTENGIEPECDCNEHAPICGTHGGCIGRYKTGCPAWPHTTVCAPYKSADDENSRYNHEWLWGTK